MIRGEDDLARSMLVNYEKQFDAQTNVVQASLDESPEKSPPIDESETVLNEAAPAIEVQDSVVESRDTISGSISPPIVDVQASSQMVNGRQLAPVRNISDVDSTSHRFWWISFTLVAILLGGFAYRRRF